MKKCTCCISLFLGEFDMESSDLHDLVLVWTCALYPGTCGLPCGPHYSSGLMMTVLTSSIEKQGNGRSQ